MLKRLLVLLIILAMITVYPSMALADELQPEENQEIDNDDESGNGTLKEWKNKKAQIMGDRKEHQIEFGELGLQIEALEKQLEEAEEDENTELIEELKEKINLLKEDMKDLKDEIMGYIEEMKSFMKSRYTEEDLEKLEKVGQGLKEKVDAVLPVENILTDKEVKFDTPPVIKDGRTLIPLRAVTEGMGAEITYDEVSHIVTIVKDATETDEKIEIVMDLEDETVKVNGDLIVIDVPAKVMNNRTMVPLRFIAEQLGLKVEWNPETQTVAIEK